MRRAVITAVVAVGLALAGTAVASAKDRDERRVAVPASGRPSFDLEIDADLDAQFGPRRVNATQAAAIVENAFPGARVTEAELDEAGGAPIWEMKFERSGREDEVDVDATTGAILADD
ncbi:PepSY domain-containing protein [Actinoplanes sp. NPDC051346]|uniref:PepSY domain-containing protein n=1 Tax=Actinoplanes sp. NPDC051346 TaxID=3155048 RepID=UPI00342D911A